MTTTTSVMTVDVPRVSARVRILLWLLVVMAVALGGVAVTVRAILQRDVDERISQLLTQETGEFANFVAQGVDPETGSRFGDPDRLLRVYLQRQYADPDEELLGLTRPGTGEPDVIRQRRDIPADIALWKDGAALTGIFASERAFGTLHRSQGSCAGPRSPSGPSVTDRPAPSSWPSTPTANAPSPIRPSGPCWACRAWRC